MNCLGLVVFIFVYGFTSRLGMSRGSGNISRNMDECADAVEPLGRDGQRQRSYTQRGYYHMMKNKLATFKIESRSIKKIIDEAFNAEGDQSKLETALTTLKNIKAGYEPSLRDLDELCLHVQLYINVNLY